MEPSEDEGLEIAQEPPETSEAEELGEAVESEEEEAENREEKAVAYKRYFRTLIIIYKVSILIFAKCSMGSV